MYHNCANPLCPQKQMVTSDPHQPPNHLTALKTRTTTLYNHTEVWELNSQEEGVSWVFPPWGKNSLSRMAC